jgi:hypothetical protein
MDQHTPPNTYQITEVYAFLSVDEGGNGVIARRFGDVMLPMIVTTTRLLDSMKVEAQRVAKETGKPIVLAKFTNREDLWRTDTI